MSVDEIATEALGIDDPKERLSYLDQACADDPKLREKVETLLSALERVDNDGFMESGLFQQKFSVSQTSDPPAAADSPKETSFRSDSKRFRLISKHALGGLGEVWVAWDRQLNREVALKQIRPEWAGNQDAEARFRREAEITGFLEHPGIVPIYALGDQNDGRPFYAMQFIRGRTLQQIVAERLPDSEHAESKSSKPTIWYTRTSLREVLDHFIDVCQTIGYAHSKGVVHRDIKPANIMLGAYGQTLVVDWGLAKRLDQIGHGDDYRTANREIDRQLETSQTSQSDSSVDETRQGTAMGTPRFMSPEQAAGLIDQIGPASDVYCLGATLYYLLAGQSPHTGESDLKSTFENIVEGNFRPPTEIRAQIPAQLQAIVMKAMATDSSDRYPTADRLAKDLQNYLSDQPISVYADPPLDRALRWARTHRAKTAALAVATLLIIFGSIAGLFVHQEMERRDLESTRLAQAKERQIAHQQEMRQLEAASASNAAVLRSQVAIADSRFSDAAALLDVAIDRTEGFEELANSRQQLMQRRDRLTRLGRFHELRSRGADFDQLTRNTEAAILLQESLQQLGVWSSDTWWIDLPDQELSAEQRNRLRWQVYQTLKSLSSIYLAQMVTTMGGGQNGKTPSTFQMGRSYLLTNRGVPEAEAVMELTHRIQSFRHSQAARWVRSIAATRLRIGRRILVKDLGPPTNPIDGHALAIASLIASFDTGYRTWFKDYGASFMELVGDTPEERYLRVALETLRRVSDDATDDFWIRSVTAQANFLLAQLAESNDHFDEAIDHYELARAEYGRCIAIRPDSPFGFTDRSTVALRQAMLMRDHPDATPAHRRRAQELLRSSYKDTSEARRLSPKSYWVYWHVGATASQLGFDEIALEAFFTAFEYGFSVQETLDAAILTLDDHRGRALGIEFAYRDQHRLLEIQGQDPYASRKATLIAALEYSKNERDLAHDWALRAIELDPANYRAEMIAGWCSLHRQDWAAAQAHFKLAMRSPIPNAITLIGAARVATQANPSQLEQANSPQLERAVQWYQKALKVAVPHRHQAAALLGVAKHAFHHNDLRAAQQHIASAKELDPACDIAPFNQLILSRAAQCLKTKRDSKDPSERDQLDQEIQGLLQFQQKILALRTASPDEITKQNNRPPRQLALLGGDFELPLEDYWTLQPLKTNTFTTSVSVGSSPPLSIVENHGVDSSQCLSLSRSMPDHPAGTWQLSQSVPVITGHTYRLRASVKGKSLGDSIAIATVWYEDNPVAELNLVGERTVFTRRTLSFDIPANEEKQMGTLEVRITVSDPKNTTILVDDVMITRESQDG